MRQRQKSGWDYVGPNVSMSWEPDTLNLVSMSAWYGYNSWMTRGSQDRAMYGTDLSTLWRTDRDFGTDGLYNGAGVQASYQHTFGREGHNIIFSYMFGYGHQHNITDYKTRTSEGDITESPYSASRNRSNDISHVVQLDYSIPFDSRHTLEAGAKLNIVDSSSISNSFFGDTAEDAVRFADLEVDMKQFKDIYALYASYSGTYGKFGAKAGLRYEYTHMGLKYHVGAYPDFTSHLNDLVPNAALSYNFTSASSLRAAYQMRIYRPGLWSMNPYVDVLSPGRSNTAIPTSRARRATTCRLPTPTTRVS